MKTTIFITSISLIALFSFSGCSSKSYSSYETTDKPKSSRPYRPTKDKNDPLKILHSIDGLTPITTDRNKCLDCHSKENSEILEVTDIPSSHISSGKVENKYYFCMECHKN